MKLIEIILIVAGLFALFTGIILFLWRWNITHKRTHKKIEAPKKIFFTGKPFEDILKASGFSFNPNSIKDLGLYKSTVKNASSIESDFFIYIRLDESKERYEVELSHMPNNMSDYLIQKGWENEYDYGSNLVVWKKMFASCNRMIHELKEIKGKFLKK
jgi:hypothetical protein